MLKRYRKLLIALGAGGTLLAATPAHAYVIYQFWQGSTLVGQVVSNDDGTICGYWGVFTGTQVIVTGPGRAC